MNDNPEANFSQSSFKVSNKVMMSCKVRSKVVFVQAAVAKDFKEQTTSQTW